MTSYAFRGPREPDPKKRAKRDAEIRKAYDGTNGVLLAKKYGLHPSRIIQIVKFGGRPHKPSGGPRSGSRKASEKFTPRPCMCCGKTFQSEGIHNRLCYDCRQKTWAMI